MQRCGSRTLNAYAVIVAFSTYFCMYAFRKPFAAATYEGEALALGGGEVEQKTLFIVSQIIGYAISKYVGIRVCSQTSRATRFGLLIGLIVAAELALILFGAVPKGAPLLKSAAIFGNGLPLGMVWGVVVLYLEGRRSSELLLTGLSCAYIVSSGVVKDVGRAVMAGVALPTPMPQSWGLVLPNPLPPVPDFWMPAVTGALFFPLLVLSAWLLEQLPEPSEQDRRERVERAPMGRGERSVFVRRYAVGIFTALSVYFVLTAYRDYRDNYAIELFSQLSYDYETHKAVVSQTELLVAFGVMIALSQLFRIQNNRIGLIATQAVMAGGLVLIGAATYLLDTGWIDGFWWMTLVGLGAYLAYVPFGSVLFDRVIASTGFVGTAVFGIYLADAIGYTGSVALMLGKDTLIGSVSHLDFLRGLSYLLAIFGTLALMLSCIAFLRRTRS